MSIYFHFLIHCAYISESNHAYANAWYFRWHSSFPIRAFYGAFCALWFQVYWIMQLVTNTIQYESCHLNARLTRNDEKSQNQIVLCLCFLLQFCARKAIEFHRKFMQKTGGFCITQRINLALWLELSLLMLIR